MCNGIEQTNGWLPILLVWRTRAQESDAKIIPTLVGFNCSTVQCA